MEITKLGSNLELEEIIQIEDGEISILDENLGLKNIVQIED